MLQREFKKTNKIIQTILRLQSDGYTHKLAESIYIINKLHFGLNRAQIILFQPSLFLRLMRSITNLLLPLLCLVLEILRPQKQHSIVSSLQLLNLSVEPCASRRNSVTKLFSKFFQVVRSRLPNLNRFFCSLSDFSPVYFVLDILLEETMITLSLLLWVRLSGSFRIWWPWPDSWVSFTVCNSIRRHVFPSFSLLRVYQLLKLSLFCRVNRRPKSFFDFHTIGLLFSENSFLLVLFLFLLDFLFDHFLQNQISEPTLVDLIAQLFLSQVLFVLSQTNLSLFSFAVLSLQLQILLFMHIQTLYVERLIFGLLLLENLIAFFLLFFDRFLKLLFFFFVERLVGFVLLHKTLKIQLLGSLLLLLLFFGLLLLQKLFKQH